MKFYILKEKTFLEKISIIFPFVTLAVLLFIMLKTENIWIKILLGINVLYFFLPHIRSLSKKGTISLNVKDILINIGNVEEKISLSDIILCKIEYGGYRNELNLMAGGFSFTNGINTIILTTKEKKYKYEFLSTKESDEKNLMNYVDFLRKNEIYFYLNMKGRIITQ
jgi:hypothetical protein